MLAREILQNLSYVGNFLAGFTIVILVYDLIRRRNNEYETKYFEKTTRTFQYTDRLRHLDTHFSNIYTYTQIKNKNNPTSKHFYWRINNNGNLYSTEVNQENYELEIRSDLIDIYRFLKEVDFILKDIKSRRLIDFNILYEAFWGYKIDINNFFIVAFDFVSSKEVRYGPAVQGLRGDFTRENLVDLIKSLKNIDKFDFLN